MASWQAMSVKAEMAVLRMMARRGPAAERRRPYPYTSRSVLSGAAAITHGSLSVP